MFRERVLEDQQQRRQREQQRQWDYRRYREQLFLRVRSGACRRERGPKALRGGGR